MSNKQKFLPLLNFDAILIRRKWKYLVTKTYNKKRRERKSEFLLIMFPSFIFWKKVIIGKYAEEESFGA